MEFDVSFLILVVPVLVYAVREWLIDKMEGGEESEESEKKHIG